MNFVIPIEMFYNGQKIVRSMGPFKHSEEREFALVVNRKAIDDCSSLNQLKEVAKNLLEGWSSMQTGLQAVMLENIQLRQVLAKKERDLEAADQMLSEAADMVQQYEKQSKKARLNLWPW